MCSSSLRALLLVAAALAAAPAAARELRVCADPNNLPFSNDRGEGFENKIVEILAEELCAKVQYT
jgi:mxaJ protein